MKIAQLIFISLIAVGLMGCATKTDLGKTDLRVDEIVTLMRSMESRRQEITERIAALERKGIGRTTTETTELENLKLSVIDISNRQNDLEKKVATLEKDGMLNSKQLSEIRKYINQLRSERNRQSQIMRDHNKKWNSIN